MSNTATSHRDTPSNTLKDQLQTQQRSIVYALSAEAFEIAKSSGDIQNLKQVGALRKKSWHFDHLVQTHFSQKTAGSISRNTQFADEKSAWSYQSPHTGKWISELKIRYLTNEKLTEHKVDALLRIIRVYDDLYGARAITTSPIDSAVTRLEDVIGIQINTRLEEVRIQMLVREILESRTTKPSSNAVTTIWVTRKNIESTADFIRDLTTLQALGFMAPQLSNMLSSYTRHPNAELNESILSTHRSAIEAALLTFYWKDPRYFESFRADKSGAHTQTVPAIKWAATIPIEPPDIRGYDDRARDHNIGMFPTELMPVLSEYVREIVYDLTRKTAPSIRVKQQHSERGAARHTKSVTQKFVSFVFSRKPDLNRITLAQEQELARLRREKSRP